MNEQMQEGMKCHRTLNSYIQTPFVCGGAEGEQGWAWGGALKPSGMEEPGVGRGCQHQTPAEGVLFLGPRGRALGEWRRE